MKNLPNLDSNFYVYKIIYLSEDNIYPDPSLEKSERYWDCEYFYYNEQGSSNFPPGWDSNGDEDKINGSLLSNL
jgi:hypothetical protein